MLGGLISGIAGKALGGGGGGLVGGILDKVVGGIGGGGEKAEGGGEKKCKGKGRKSLEQLVRAKPEKAKAKLTKKLIEAGMDPQQAEQKAGNIVQNMQKRLGTAAPQKAGGAQPAGGPQGPAKAGGAQPQAGGPQGQMGQLVQLLKQLIDMLQGGRAQGGPQGMPGAQGGPQGMPGAQGGPQGMPGAQNTNPLAQMAQRITQARNPQEVYAAKNQMTQNMMQNGLANPETVGLVNQVAQQRLQQFGAGNTNTPFPMAA